MTAQPMFCLDLVSFVQPDRSMEEYFFIVERSKRNEDVGFLLHMVGNGTPQLSLKVTENFKPSSQKSYRRRQFLGYIASVDSFIGILNYAPLHVTKEHRVVTKEVYQRWKLDMIDQAKLRGVLIE